MTLGIASIASYVPKGQIDNVEQAAAFGESREFVERKIGALTLSRMAPTEDTSDLAVKACEKLFSQNRHLHEDDVDALVVVTQNPDGNGMPHCSALVQKKLGLPNHVAAFDISLGCSGYVYGLFALSGFLKAIGKTNGILVTADPYSKIIDTNDRVTSLLFGDAATATWLSPQGAWKLGSVLMGTNGDGAEYLCKTAGNLLQMNGRQVFNMASTLVPSHLQQLLNQAELTDNDIDAYLIHQGSAAIVDAVARRSGFPTEKFIKQLSDTGNTVSSSIPLLLESRLISSEQQRFVLSGFGVGFSWASTIIEKTN